jgi:hypothetical protein
MSDTQSVEPLDLAQESVQYDDDPVVKDTVAKVNQLNESINNMRLQGYDPAYIDQYRREQTDAILVSHYHNAYQAKQQAEEQLNKSIERWKNERDKHPERRMLHRQDMQIEVNAMTEKEVLKEVGDYLDDKAEPEYEKLLLLANRLQSIDPGEAHSAGGNPISLEGLRSEMKRKRASEPWIRDERIAELDYKARKYGTEFGRLTYRIGPQRSQVQHAKIEDMVRK